MKNCTGITTIKIFLDSNVILSGLISENGAPRTILDVLCLNYPFLSACTGEYNIIEIKRNLDKKLPRGIPVYEQYLPRLNLEIVPLPSYKEIQPYLEIIVAKDAPVLCSAKLANADYLITGDKKDFGKLQQSDELSYKIISPSEFINSVLPELIKKIM